MKMAKNLKNSRVLPVVIFFFFMIPELPAQDTLTLETCYLLAEKNYPLVNQQDMYTGTSELRTKNLNKNYLPSFNLTGSASYQSDITVVEIALPAGLPEIGMPVLSKDWYKATLDINQMIYDGNVTRYQKKLEEYNLQADQTGLKAELYKLKERVNLFYFTIILLNQNEKLLESNLERLNVKLKETIAGVQFGTALQSNADALEAEIIRTRQLISETQFDRTAAFNMLAELLSVPIAESTVLTLPNPNLSSLTFENKRYENESYDLQRTRLQMMRDMVTTKWNPRFFAYGQAGFGRPGLNMLSNNFEPWWLVGAKVTWVPWNWNANKNEKKILDIQSGIVLTQQQAFDKNLRIQSEKDLSEILKASDLLQKDQDIIRLREKVTAAASVQLDNGVITSSEYINRLNEETQARLNYEIRRVQLVKARLNFLYNQGKL
jgi:outer membrane protein TolC